MTILKRNNTNKYGTSGNDTTEKGQFGKGRKGKMTHLKRNHLKRKEINQNNPEKEIVDKHKYEKLQMGSSGNEHLKNDSPCKGSN